MFLLIKVQSTRLWLHTITHVSLVAILPGFQFSIGSSTKRGDSYIVLLRKKRKSLLSAPHYYPSEETEISRNRGGYVHTNISETQEENGKQVFGLSFFTDLLWCWNLKGSEVVDIMVFMRSIM